jgi:hypothetical protein
MSNICMGCVCNMWVGLAMGAVLRALCRVAVLRVLTAYIPRTPGPKKATRAWPEPGLLALGAMEYVWNMYGIYMYVYGICMEHGIYRACLQKKKTYGLCMDLLRIRIENVRIAYANSPLGLDGVGHY